MEFLVKGPFRQGDLVSFDAIVDRHGNPLAVGKGLRDTVELEGRVVNVHMSTCSITLTVNGMEHVPAFEVRHENLRRRGIAAP